MAEAMFRALLCETLGCENHELREQGYEVLSAGVHTMNGLPASIETIQVLAAQGIQLLDHASQPLSRELLEVADVVYAMTNSHLESILANWPEFENRVELLSRKGIDVCDPIGMGIDAYQHCKAQIDESLRTIFDNF